MNTYIWKRAAAADAARSDRNFEISSTLRELRSLQQVGIIFESSFIMVVVQLRYAGLKRLGAMTAKAKADYMFSSGILPSKFMVKAVSIRQP
jgi:hypothetical protein